MPAKSFEPFLRPEFELYRPELRRDEAYNPQRLVVRRKLKALADRAKAEAKEQGEEFDLRESLHNPHPFNHKSVVAQWTYLTRTAKEKKVFKSLFGDALGKDVDPAYSNVYLAFAVDHDGFLIALRIHPEAWYDALNLKNKLSDEAQMKRWVELLRSLPPGYDITVEGWRRAYPCATAQRDEQRELFKMYTPGEHRLILRRAIPKDDPLATSAELADVALQGFHALIPLYRFAAWSEENAWLKFGGA